MALSFYPVIGIAMQSQFRNLLSSCRPALLRQSKKEESILLRFSNFRPVSWSKKPSPSSHYETYFSYSLSPSSPAPAPARPYRNLTFKCLLASTCDILLIIPDGGGTCVMGFGALRFPRLSCHWNSKRIGQNFYHASPQYFHIHKLWHHFDSFPSRHPSPRTEHRMFRFISSL